MKVHPVLVCLCVWTLVWVGEAVGEEVGVGEEVSTQLRWEGRTAGELSDTAMQPNVNGRLEAVRGLGELAIFEPDALLYLRGVMLRTEGPVALAAAEEVAGLGAEGEASGEVVRAVARAWGEDREGAEQVLSLWVRQRRGAEDAGVALAEAMGLALVKRYGSESTALGVRLLEAAAAVGVEGPSDETRAALRALMDQPGDAATSTTTAFAALGVLRLGLREGEDDAYAALAVFGASAASGVPTTKAGELTPLAERLVSVLEGSDAGRDAAAVLAQSLHSRPDGLDAAWGEWAAWAALADSCTGPTATARLALIWDHPRAEVHAVARLRLTQMLDAGIVNTDPDAVDAEAVRQRVLGLPAFFDEKLQRSDADLNPIVDPAAGLGTPAIQPLVDRLRADKRNANWERERPITSIYPAARALMRIGEPIRPAILDRLGRGEKRELCADLLIVWKTVVAEGNAGENPLEPFVAALRHPDWWVRLAAAKNLRFFAFSLTSPEYDVHTVLAALTEAISVEGANWAQGEMIQLALLLVSHQHESTPQTQAALRAVLRASPRQSLFPTLGRWGLDTVDIALLTPVADELVRVAGEASGPVALAAVKQLMRIDHRGPAVTALIGTLRESEDASEELAGILLASREGDGDAAAELAVTLILSGGAWKEVDHKVVWVMRPHAAAMIPPLLGTLENPGDPAQRAAVAQVAHAISVVIAAAPRDDRLAQAVEGILLDDRWSLGLRQRAGIALATIAPLNEPQADMILRPLLRQPNLLDLHGAPGGQPLDPSASDGPFSRAQWSRADPVRIRPVLRPARPRRRLPRCRSWWTAWPTFRPRGTWSIRRPPRTASSTPSPPSAPRPATPCRCCGSTPTPSRPRTIPIAR